MPNGKDAQEIVQTASLPGSVGALGALVALVAALPADDSVMALRQITEALAAINATHTTHTTDTLALQARYDDIALLETATVTHSRLLLQEYLNTSRHIKQRESDLWNSAYDGWRELGAAYIGCVKRGTDDHVATRVAAARALRALRRQLQWLRIRYALPPRQIWEDLAQLYARCEPGGIHEQLAVYPDETTTIQREFLKALALTILTVDNLTPPEQDLAAFVVSRYANDFVLSTAPDAGCTHSFDLKHPQAPLPVPAGADLRYFGAGAAAASLEAALRTLEQAQQVPAALNGFKVPIKPEQWVEVLRQICLDWAGTPLERRQQREKNNARITVVPGFRAMLHEIEHATSDPFDFTAQPAGESWIVSDISADGFGVVMPAVSGDWVSVGSVAGIERAASGSWSVGIVRRVRRLDQGQQHIGMQVVCHNAQAVRVMREASGTGTRLTQRMPIDRGLLLTADAVHQKQIELLVSDPALYTAGNLHVLAGETAVLVALHEVLEGFADCALIRLTVLGSES